MRRLLAAAFAMCALAACRVDSTVDVSLRADGTGVVTLTAVADAELVAKAPGLAEDLRFDDATAAGWKVDGPTATADGGLKVVLHHDVTSAEQATALLAAINGADGPLHGVVVGRTVTDADITTTLHGTLRVANGIDAFADPDVLKAIGGSPYANAIAEAQLRPTDVVTFTLTAHLPGQVHNTGTTPAKGTAAASPTSWSVPLDGTTLEVDTTSVLAQGTPSSGWGTLATVALVALVVWCVAAIAFITFVAKARRDRARRALSPR